MEMTGLLHAAHLGGSLPAYRAFMRALIDPERAQRRRLVSVLDALSKTERWGSIGSGHSYEAFREKVPTCSYADLEKSLEQQRESKTPLVSPSCERWQPTSGSTSRRKWIPYPPAFLVELDAAAGAWMVDLALRVPHAFRGRHYWSLSWVPSELRQAGMESDDLTLLPAWKRWTLGNVMAVPQSVGSLSSNKEALLATATWLASRSDLTLFSAWSPTFGLALLHILSEQRETVAETLREGKWTWPIPAPKNRRAADLFFQWDGALTSVFFAELWPGLSLLSTWDSAGSQSHATNFAALLPKAKLQGKGLWATEGVVSIPFRDQMPLALTSHFLEFRCFSTNRILPAWELEPGQELQPLLTTSGGLVRYLLDDRVTVTGFLHRTPCLRFQGRLGGTDMVGEKLDESAVTALLDSVTRAHGIRCFTLFAVDMEPPRYCLLAEGGSAPSPDFQLELEKALCSFHQYHLARELHQLAQVEVLVVPDASAFLAKRARRNGMTSGEMKVQSLEEWGLAIHPCDLDCSDV